MPPIRSISASVFAFLHLAVAQCSAAEEVARALPVTHFSELLEVQSEVMKKLPQVRAALVAIQVGPSGEKESTGAAASGIIISPDGLILTAAHVVDKPGRQLRVVMADGTLTSAVALGIDTSTDAAMARLRVSSRDKKWPHVQLGHEPARALPGDWCFALGHPGGYDSERGPVLRVGKIVRHTANKLHSDCVLMGGDSGGPLFNLRGELIGIHSLIWEERDENVHVSMTPYLRSWDSLLASRVIEEWSANAGGFLGIVMQEDNELEEGEMKIMDVVDGSPAQRADLRAGDRILSLNDVPMTVEAQFLAAIRARPAGETIRLNLLRDGKRHTVKVQLSKKPQES